VKKIRNYYDILARLQSALDGSASRHDLGTIRTPSDGYPLIRIVLGQGNPYRVLISAGIHGDEPAGVETVCTFLEQGGNLLAKGPWEISVLPCINPFGYEHGTRNNYEGKDLNREFKNSDPPREVSLVRDGTPFPFHLTLELHEDVDSPGYYLYQKTATARQEGLGFRIVERVEPHMAINRNEMIEEMEAEGGVIHRLKNPGEMDFWPMALYALAQGTQACLTLESSPRFPMATRVKAHLAAISGALEHFPILMERESRIKNPRILKGG